MLDLPSPLNNTAIDNVGLRQTVISLQAFATGHFEGVYLRKRKSPLAGVVWDYLDPQAPNRQAFP